MSRAFDWRYELASIHEGMERDLHQPVGQVVPWYVFDAETTEVDPIYDTGSASVGRRWLDPVRVPTLSVIKYEGREIRNDRGEYITSTLNVVISAAALQKCGLADVVLNPEHHTNDRIVYEGMIFDIGEVRGRGVLTAGYAVVGISAAQVMPEELVNDPQFVSLGRSATP